MKKLISFSVLFLFIHLLSQAQQRKSVIAIGFYNCENFFHPENDSTKQDDDFTPGGAFHYTDEVYHQKLHNIATVIQKLGTDVTPDGAAIIGMAEIENDKVLKDLISQPEIKDRNYKYVWFPTPDVRGISTAMIYNPKYFRVISKSPVHIPLETLGQTRPTRDILYVQGILVGNDTVNVLVNHWPSRGGGVVETTPYRNLAASVDRKIADSLFSIDPNTRVLIMGDLNDNPTDQSVLKFINARADTAKTELTDIFNPWIKIYKKGFGSEAYQGEWNLIDQIMMSGAFLKNHSFWQFYKAQIFSKEFLTNQTGESAGFPHRSFDISQNWDNGYSDHYPVVIYLVH
jgi:predicted extracellular nuclease